MGALARLAFFIFAPFFCLSSVDAKTTRWGSEVREASHRFGIPEYWIRNVIAAESGGRAFMAGHPIVSSAGAMGLMQLMPETWTEMRALHRLGQDPFDAHDNILAGTAYLRAMYDRFGYPGLFAAYNAGPSRYSRHLRVGEGLPDETVAYLAKLTRCDVRPREARSCPHRPRRLRLPDETAQGLFVIQRERAANLLGVVPRAQGQELPALRSPRSSFFPGRRDSYQKKRAETQ